VYKRQIYSSLFLKIVASDCVGISSTIKVQALL